MKIINNPIVLIILSFVITLSSCNKDEDSPEDNTPTDVQLNIKLKHFVGIEHADFDTIMYTNAFGNNFSVVTLKYFISNITLYKSDGTEVLIDEEHYVDALDEATNTFIPAHKIPEGSYDSISFVFGLNEEKNVSGLFPNAPESNMEWPIPMGGGYHYMKLEGKFDENGTIKNYQCHTGPTMGNPNFIEVSLPVSQFTTSNNELTITIGMKINKWWESPNVFDLNDISGIMGDQSIQLLLQENGNDVFSLISVE